MYRMRVGYTLVLCADKGYDSEVLRKHNTKLVNDHMDWHLYKSRHVVENVFAKLKKYSAAAPSVDKLKQSYENIVVIACAYF